MSATWADFIDKGGETIKVECFDGLYFPPKPIPVTSEEQCHNIRDMSVRDDDVFILSYPKSGTHLLWEMTQMIVNGSTEYSKDRMPVYALDITSKKDLEMPDNSWFNFTLEWQKELEARPELNVLHMHYEEMKKDPVLSVKKICSFLERDLSEEMCRSIAEACSFRRLKSAYDNVKGDKLKGEWKDGSGSGIFRKGEIGDWKNWFTVVQNERFDQEYEKKMQDIKWTLHDFIRGLRPLKGQ